MMFDSIPQWLSRRTIKGLKLSDRYRPADAVLPVPDDAVALAGRIPGVRAAHDVPYPQPGTAGSW